MPFGRRRRKFLLCAGLAVAGLAVTSLSLPLWFPWVLRPLARHYGVRYSVYEGLGYHRFALRDVRFTNESANVSAGRVEAQLPMTWAWRCFRPHKSGTEESVYVTNWQFLSVTTTRTSRPVLTQFETLATTLNRLNRWVPGAVLYNGALKVAAVELTVPVVRWYEGKLWAELQVPLEGRVLSAFSSWEPTNALKSASFSLLLQPAAGQPGKPKARNVQAYALRVNSNSLHLNSDLTFFADASGLAIQTTNVFFGNHVEGHAHFSHRAVLPETAALHARDFKLPGRLVGLPDYEQVSATVSAVWERGEFNVELGAGASPTPARGNLPSLQVSLYARGDTNSVTIRTAGFSAGGLRAELSQGVNLYYTAPWLREPATLRLNADLHSLPWVSMQGNLSGNVELPPGRATYPIARFELSGSEISVFDLTAHSVHLAGELNWPRFELTKADAVLADGSRAGVEGNMELNKRIVSAGRFEIRGPFACRWLPAATSYGSLTLSGSMDGPLDEIRHRGRLEMAEFTAPHLRPLTISADWRGRKANLDFMEVNIGSGPESVLYRGALIASTNRVELSVTNLSLLAKDQPMLELTGPCQLSLNRPDSSGALQIYATPFEWTGRGGRLHLEASALWPRQGALRMSAEGIASSLVTGFLRAELPPMVVRMLLTELGWTNSPVVGELDLAATGHFPQGTGLEKAFDLLSSETITNAQPGLVESTPGPKPAQPASAQAPQPNRNAAAPHAAANPEFSINLKMSADQNGLAVSNLVITCESAPLASLHGFLPLTLRPDSPTNLLHLDREAALACEANVLPEGPFWGGIAAWTGIGFRNPGLDLSLAGSWQDPRGSLDLEAEQIQFARTNVALPSFEALRISVQVDAQQARLTEGRLRIQGQPLSLTAAVPLGADFWSGVPSKSRLDWRQATAHLHMTNVELAAFQPLYRELLTPQGNLDVDVSLLPGMNLQGAAVLQRARTRPLGELGPIRDIGATLRFTAQEVRLESATASVGRAPVQLAGRAELKGFNWLHGALPSFELSLRGTNVLLQREPESIIRGDLDLAVVKTNGAAPLISGAAHLRDSYYLRDLSALVPGKIASPERRPPYFSITDPALADWRLALNVDGTRFMRVRGPLFNGEISATVKVQGTLRDPLALGDCKVDSGFVRLPFATFQVQQGLATLTSKDPYRPELLVTAASKQYGYDIRMEITGPADAPLVQFTSTPPLSSEQILLMVTAGEIPQATFSLTTQQRAQTVALFFGKDLLSKLGLGDQSQERLEVTSGEEISDQGRPTYNVEYKLSDQWSVVGAYDRFGDFNAGFKWLLYSK